VHSATGLARTRCESLKRSHIAGFRGLLLSEGRGTESEEREGRGKEGRRKGIKRKKGSFVNPRF